MAEKIERIEIIHTDDISSFAKSEVDAKVKKWSPDRQSKFKGYVEFRMVSASPMRVQSFEPIEGTDIDWMKRQNEDSEIDISNIF